MASGSLLTASQRWVRWPVWMSTGAPDPPILVSAQPRSTALLSTSSQIIERARRHGRNGIAGNRRAEAAGDHELAIQPLDASFHSAIIGSPHRLLVTSNADGAQQLG
jgi:hypothetical protein